MDPFPWLVTGTSFVFYACAAHAHLNVQTFAEHINCDVYSCFHAHQQHNYIYIYKNIWHVEFGTVYFAPLQAKQQKDDDAYDESAGSDDSSDSDGPDANNESGSDSDTDAEIPGKDIPTAPPDVPAHPGPNPGVGSNVPNVSPAPAQEALCLSTGPKVSGFHPTPPMFVFVNIYIYI